MKNIKWFFGMFFLIFLFCPFVFAEEIKIVFTGQSYSALYPCHCPIEPSGGVARRASLIKTIRTAHKRVLVIEAGSSFASGGQDQYSQNYEMDSRRSDVYLKSLNIMGYDALLLSSQEYVFGTDFLKRYKELPFLSSNTEQEFSVPYIVKDLKGVKVGILGITDSLAVSKGAKGWLAPDSLLDKKISELRKKGINIIVLLSSLTQQEDEKILRNIKGIDVVINGSQSFGSVELQDKNGVVYLTTWWQAKKVAMLTLEIVNSKIVKKSLESTSLKPEISDDASILSVLPQCFQDGDCKATPGIVPKCENGSTKEAKCVFINQPKVSLTIIRPRVCRTCRIEEINKGLGRTFKDLTIDYLYEDDVIAKNIIKEFNLTMLPAYLFHKDIENSEIFSSYSNGLVKGENFYLLKFSQAGVSYLLGRNEIPKKLDVFFDFSYKKLPELFDMLKVFHQKHKDIDIGINFLTVQDDAGKFVSKGGNLEIEEFGRLSCIDELYPGALFDYIICRAKNIESSWWDSCAEQFNIDVKKIKKCALSVEGKEVMLKRAKLTQELQIASSPTFIVNNKEIFGIENVPSLEEFEGMVIR